jgi:glycosyltransferase involved in cell wall biosynthesis
VRRKLTDVSAPKKTLAIVHGGTFRGYPLGGIETFLGSVLPFLHERYEIKLIGRSMGEPPGRWTKIGVAGQEFSFLPVMQRESSAWLPDRVSLAMAIMRYGRRVKESGADTYYVHMTEAAISLLMLTRKPIVVHVHGLYNLFQFSRYRLGRPYAWIYEKIYPVLFSRCAKVLGVGSREEFDIFARGMRAKSGVPVPTCLRKEIFYARDRATVRRELGVAADEKVVLFVGRMTVTKNPQLLLDCLKHLRPEFPGLKAVFAGDGPLREEIASAGAQLGNVVVTGRVSPTQAALWMNAADVLAVVSKAEAFTSIAALEALSCGTPVVATPVSALPEVIRQGQNGAVADGFSVESYCRALRRVFVSPPQRDACCASVREYSPEAVTKQIISELDEVCAGGDAPHASPARAGNIA